MSGQDIKVTGRQFWAPLDINFPQIICLFSPCLKFPKLEASKHIPTARLHTAHSSVGSHLSRLQHYVPAGAFSILPVSHCLSLHYRTSRTILSASPAAVNEASLSWTQWAFQAPAPGRQIDLGDEMKSDLNPFLEHSPKPKLSPLSCYFLTFLLYPSSLFSLLFYQSFEYCMGYFYIYHLIKRFLIVNL